MKNKKLFLPAVILIVAVLATVAYTVISHIAKKPTITEAEFPFSITYELDGETVTINEVYKARYVGNSGYSDTLTRMYVGETESSGDTGTVYTLKKSENGRIELWTHIYPDYLMGDPEGDYFDDREFEPSIYFFDLEETEYSDEETLAAHGVKLISFEYPTPIKNSFVFSHISYTNSVVVIPTMIIALLALIATFIFVKKEIKYKTIDIISIVFNWIITVVYLPFVTVLGGLIDIEGGGPELYYQFAHFLPVFSLLSIVASVALRRKGYGISSLIAQFAGPAAFVIYLAVFYSAGLMY